MTTPISFHSCTAQGVGAWAAGVLFGLSFPLVNPGVGTHLQRAPVRRNHSGLSRLSQEGGRLHAKDKPPCFSEAFTTSLCHRNANSSAESGSGCCWKGTVLARSTTALTTEPQKRKMRYSGRLLLFSFTAVATEAQRSEGRLQH